MEITYEKSQQQVDATVEVERARLFRLKIWYLEEENDRLRFQLSEQNDCTDELERFAGHARKEAQTMEAVIGRLERALQTRTRETEKFKTEVESLRIVSKDTAKLHAEKLALSRELSTLKPEVNHLRVQSAAGEGLLTEKLSLQRELNSVRVELETERRSLQRAIFKEEGRSVLDSQLKSQLETIQIELSRERKDKEKLESERSKLKIDFEGHKTLLESKVEALRGRLKATREQLKESQSALEKNRQTLGNHKEATLLGTNRNTRKRTLQEADEDAAFGTPGDRPATKKLKRGSTLPGDKSLFSITPFLNRTASLAPEDLQSIKENGPSSDTKDRQEAKVSFVSEAPNTRVTRPATTTSKTSQTSRMRLLRAVQEKGLTKLDRVQEEGAEDNQLGEPTVALQRPIEAQKGAEEHVNDRAQEKDGAKKKQRPLGRGLAKTLFDEEEGGVEQNAPIESLKFTGSKRVLLAPRSGRIDGGLLGAFSPLKKDRRV